jgi:hypothetical protein
MAQIDFIVVEAGFFYGTYYAKGATISLTEEQAKYDLLHGSIEKSSGYLVDAAASASGSQIEAPPTAPPMTARQKPPRRSISNLE